MNKTKIFKTTLVATGLVAMIGLTAGCTEKEVSAPVKEKKEQGITYGEPNGNQGITYGEPNPSAPGGLQVEEKQKEEISIGIPLRLQVENNQDYAFDQEEPNMYIFQYKKDDSFFTRIEIVDKQSDLNDVKINAKEYLMSTGNPTEIATDQTIPFYTDTAFFLHASNSKESQNVVVKEIDGVLLKFTIHFPNKETAEDVTPVMLDVLNTLSVAQ